MEFSECPTFRKILVLHSTSTKMKYRMRCCLLDLQIYLYTLESLDSGANEHPRVAGTDLATQIETHFVSDSSIKTPLSFDAR